MLLHHTTGPEMQLFIVEDSIPVRDRLVRTIEDLPGLEIVGTAEDVPAAITGLTDRHPDALILDLQLPSGSGLQVLRAVREKLPKLRVIVMTNFAAEPYRKAAMAAGAEVFLDKSAEFGRVRDILSGWRDEADVAAVH
jgi:DNA-binding NarL/FixJ family response regulator